MENYAKTVIMYVKIIIERGIPSKLVWKLLNKNNFEAINRL